MAQAVIRGYVQAVKEDEKHECDYVTFWILDESDIYKKAENNTHYEIIGVTVPWSLDVAFEEGDHAEIVCVIRSWSKDGYVKLELRAIEAGEINDGMEELMR
jgi:hypothetical protein